jgi:hypothetical protein
MLYAAVRSYGMGIAVWRHHTSVYTYSRIRCISLAYFPTRNKPSVTRKCKLLYRAIIQDNHAHGIYIVESLLWFNAKCPMQTVIYRVYYLLQGIAKRHFIIRFITLLAGNAAESDRHSAKNVYGNCRTEALVGVNEWIDRRASIGSLFFVEAYYRNSSDVCNKSSVFIYLEMIIHISWSLYCSS